MSFGWIITFVTAVVAICAILAAFGFRGRVSTVGIDLGTTFSVVGVSINGKVVIIEDKEGHRIFPSIVSYQENGDILAGYQALPFMSSQPASTIFNAKRFIGRSLHDEDGFREYAAAHPFKIVEIDGRISNYSKVGFEISVQDDENSDSNDSNGKKSKTKIISPESVGTQVLKHLMEVTASFLGHRQVKNAVIAVPAKFTPLQRQATGAAYKAAGLKVVRVLEEPTAAAVAYRLHKRKDIHHILVYDFGGGTLDVSLLFVSKGSVQVYATDGDDMLGGSDLDLCLYDVVKQKVELAMRSPVLSMAEYLSNRQQRASADVDLGSVKESVTANTTDNSGGDEWDNNNNNDNNIQKSSPKRSNDRIEGSSNNNDNNNDLLIMSEWCVSNALRNKAELIKKNLTYHDSVTMTCLAPTGGANDRGSSSSSTLKEISFTVTLQEFESHCDHLFARAMLPVTRLLTDLDMRKEEVDEVVLVGGSTRIPKVKRMLKEYFGKELNDHIDPDVTVAYGAASILD